MSETPRAHTGLCVNYRIAVYINSLTWGLMVVSKHSFPALPLHVLLCAFHSTPHGIVLEGNRMGKATSAPGEAPASSIAFAPNQEQDPIAQNGGPGLVEHRASLLPGVEIPRGVWGVGPSCWGCSLPLSRAEQTLGSPLSRVLASGKGLVIPGMLLTLGQAEQTLGSPLSGVLISVTGFVFRTTRVCLQRCWLSLGSLECSDCV